MNGVPDFIDETGCMTRPEYIRIIIFECLGVLIYSDVMIAMQCILCKANLTFRSVFF